MVSSSRSVILDMAETTIATGRFLLSRAVRAAAARMRSAEPTLVPPNFITRRSRNRTPFRGLRLDRPIFLPSRGCSGKVRQAAPSEAPAQRLNHIAPTIPNKVIESAVAHAPDLPLQQGVIGGGKPPAGGFAIFDRVRNARSLGDGDHLVLRDQPVQSDLRSGFSGRGRHLGQDAFRISGLHSGKGKSERT